MISLLASEPCLSGRVGSSSSFSFTSFDSLVPSSTFLSSKYSALLSIKEDSSCFSAFVSSSCGLSSFEVTLTVVASLRISSFGPLIISSFRSICSVPLPYVKESLSRSFGSFFLAFVSFCKVFDETTTTTFPKSSSGRTVSSRSNSSGGDVSKDRAPCSWSSSIIRRLSWSSSSPASLPSRGSKQGGGGPLLPSFMVMSSFMVMLSLLLSLLLAEIVALTFRRRRIWSQPAVSGLGQVVGSHPEFCTEYYALVDHCTQVLSSIIAIMVEDSTLFLVGRNFTSDSTMFCINNNEIRRRNIAKIFSQNTFHEQQRQKFLVLVMFVPEQEHRGPLHRSMLELE